MNMAKRPTSSAAKRKTPSTKDAPPRDRRATGSLSALLAAHAISHRMLRIFEAVLQSVRGEGAS